MTRSKAAWAAGVIATMGSFLIVSTSGTAPAAVRYVARTSKNPEALTRLASIAGVNVTSARQGDKIATQVVLQGSTLHRLMTLVWDELTIERKKEYAAARREVKDRVDANV